MSTRSSTSLTALAGVAGLIATRRGTIAEGADELEGPVQMRARFGVDRDVVGPRLGERGDVWVGRCDHQVDVKFQPGMCGRSALSTGAPKLRFGTK